MYFYLATKQVIAKSFYGRKVAVKDYSDTDPGWTPAMNSRAKSRGGGKATTGAKRGRKPKEAEVYVISSDESEEEVSGRVCVLVTGSGGGCASHRENL